MTLLLLAASALAAAPEMRGMKECLLDIGGLQIRVGHSGELTDAELKTLHRLFAELKEMMPNHPVPEGLALYLLREGTGASYDRGGLIEATLCFRCERTGFKLPPEAVLSIIAHEYGHAAFSERMKKELPDWEMFVKRGAHGAAVMRIDRDMKQVVTELREANQLGEHEDPIMIWARRADEVGNEKLKVEDVPNPLFQKWLALRRRRDVMEAGAPKFTDAERKRMDALDSASRTYDELFGDCVAVLRTGDPKAVVPDGLARPRLGKRDFSQDLAALEARPGYATEKQEFRFLDAYSVLAPTRAFLWKEYFSKPENRGKRDAMLERLLRAVVPEIRHRLESGVGERVTEKEINDRLMDAIRREFRGL